MSTGTSTKKYCLIWNEKRYGPYTLEQLSALKKAGKIPKGKGIKVREVFEKPTEPVLEPVDETVLEVEDDQISYNETPVEPPQPPRPMKPKMREPSNGGYSNQPLNIQGHVTTERTAKNLKLHVVYAWAVFGVGLLLVYMASGSSSEDGPNAVAMIGSLMVVGSFVYGFVNRVRVWWNHG